MEWIQLKPIQSIKGTTVASLYRQIKDRIITHPVLIQQVMSGDVCVCVWGGGGGGGGLIIHHAPFVQKKVNNTLLLFFC